MIRSAGSSSRSPVTFAILPSRYRNVLGCTCRALDA